MDLIKEDILYICVCIKKIRKKERKIDNIRKQINKEGSGRWRKNECFRVTTSSEVRDYETRFDHVRCAQTREKGKHDLGV